MKLQKLLLTTLVVSAFATQAFAERGNPRTGRLHINGKVPELCELNVKATPKSKDILDISRGDTNRLVGYVYEKCNDAKGYTVTMVSKNAGDFTGLFIDSESKDSHAFAIAYNGKLAKRNVVTDSKEPAVDFIEKPVTITYGENPTLSSSEAFTYSEMLTFTIAAK